MILDVPAGPASAADPGTTDVLALPGRVPSGPAFSNPQETQFHPQLVHHLTVDNRQMVQQLLVLQSSEDPALRAQAVRLESDLRQAEAAAQATAASSWRLPSSADVGVVVPLTVRDLPSDPSPLDVALGRALSEQLAAVQNVHGQGQHRAEKDQMANRAQ